MSDLSGLIDYASTVILDHAKDIEMLSIYEMAEQHLGREITDDEADIVDKLISKAKIQVSWTAEDLTAESLSDG